MAGQGGRLPTHLRHADLTKRPLCEEAQTERSQLLGKEYPNSEVHRYNRAICFDRVNRIVKSVDQIRFVKSSYSNLALEEEPCVEDDQVNTGDLQ
jgi:alanine racemase